MIEEADSDSTPSVKGVQRPTMDLAAFVCPHCSAHTQQQWHKVFTAAHDVGAVPQAPDEEHFRNVIRDIQDPDQRNYFKEYTDKLLSHLPAFEKSKQGQYVYQHVVNLHLSQCYICDGTAVWLRDRMVWPSQAFEVKPNGDLPDHIKADFVEAAAIASVSPRGAAALLRLAIERLCIHLGKEGSIDAMIGQLVTEGLNVRVKQALDVVRVTGNDAVHPGTITFGDDPSTVSTLFKMVNLIAEKMISEPKHVDEAFASLPPEKRKWIEDRDKGALRKQAQWAAPVPSRPDEVKG